MKTKFLALFLAITLFSLPLLSCGKRGPVAMEYDDVKVTEAMLLYWLGHYKSIFLEAYPDMNDTDEFWSTVVSEGLTAEEYFTEVTLENVKKNVAAAWLFDYMGMKFTGDMRKEIKNGIKDMKEYFADIGDDFDLMLTEYGLTEYDLYDIYEIDAKVNYAYEMLYGAGGVIDIPDVDKLIYTKENYVHIEHLYINNLFRYVTVENELGTFTHDPETGEAYVESLSEEEKAVKDTNIAAVKAGLENGVSFEELWDLYSEDKLYGDGYYLKKNSTFIKEIVDEAFTMEVGDVRILETDYGFHVIKCYEIEGTPWDDSANKDFFGEFDSELADYIFTVMLDETAKKVTVNGDVVGKYTIKDVKPNSYF